MRAVDEQAGRVGVVGAVGVDDVDVQVCDALERVRLVLRVASMPRGVEGADLGLNFDVPASVKDVAPAVRADVDLDLSRLDVGAREIGPPGAVEHFGDDATRIEPPVAIVAMNAPVKVPAEIVSRFPTPTWTPSASPCEPDPSPAPPVNVPPEIVRLVAPIARTSPGPPLRFVPDAASEPTKVPPEIEPDAGLRMTAPGAPMLPTTGPP